MRSYLMAYISTYTIIALLICDLSSSHRVCNCLLNAFAASLRNLRQSWLSTFPASFWGKQPSGPVLCTQKYLPPCWCKLYIDQMLRKDKLNTKLKIKWHACLLECDLWETYQNSSFDFSDEGWDSLNNLCLWKIKERLCQVILSSVDCI